MSQGPVVDLYAPFTTDRLLEVRMGKMKVMPGLKVESGIDKPVCEGSVYVNNLGIEGDEHDLTFHGGPDKAIHGYCSSHYANWQNEFPSAAARFQPGGFGENFVTAHMNERNVCIGDVISVGTDGLLLEVSLPRQPCYKLNHRFQLKNFAPNTWRTSRTGWYYRVVHEGRVSAGDEIRLVQRRHPTWTIERVQEFLHRNQGDAEMNALLAEIEQLGEESRGAFRRRVAKAKAKEKKEREAAEEKKKWRAFRVAEKTPQTPRITSFVLEAVDLIADADDAALDEGAHARIKLGNGLVRAYSIVEGDKNKFQIAVARDEASRGGSVFLHDKVHVDDVVQVGAITASVPIATLMSNHIFVAGGIGITPFLALVEAYRGINYSAILHYAVRSADDVPFRERLDKLGDGVRVYDKAQAQRLDLREIVRSMPWNSQLYFCGPRRLMDEARQVCQELKVPEKEVHYEAFEADVSGDPFEAVVKNRGDREVQVGAEESLLDALKRVFGDGDDGVASSCEVGNCGTCKVVVKEGSVAHRGTALTAEEKQEGAMLTCVSRGVGRIVVEL